MPKESMSHEELRAAYVAAITKLHAIEGAVLTARKSDLAGKIAIGAAMALAIHDDRWWMKAAESTSLKRWIEEFLITYEEHRHG